MGSQRFRASERFEFNNGAVGWRPGGFADCIGPFAKVQNCPIAGTGLRRTAYASGYADTFFSVPAFMNYRGQHVAGYFTSDEGGCTFNVSVRHQHRVPIVEHMRALQAMRERLGSLTSSVRAFYQWRRNDCKRGNVRWLPSLQHARSLITPRISEIRTLRAAVAAFEANTPGA